MISGTLALDHVGYQPSLPSAWSPQITASLSAALMMSDRTWLCIELRDNSHRKQAQPAAMTQQDDGFDREPDMPWH